MKKHTTAKKNQQALVRTRQQIRARGAEERLTVGLDLGDRTISYCILDGAGMVMSAGKVATSGPGLESLLAKMPASRVVLEVGTHSPWVSRQASGLGHEVVVANTYRVKLITRSAHKNDRTDAETLARLGRIDPGLLGPIRHRGAQAQADLAVIRGRAELLEARTSLINCARGLVKAMGERLRNCEADRVGEELAEDLSEEACQVVVPLLRSVARISEQIAGYDQRIEQIGKRYPETERLTQVYGVGTLIALTFVLTIEDAQRFEHSRDVGPYLGMCPKQRDSGESQPELGITKGGDKLLRSYLVQAAHCNLRKGAAESDLRSWGLQKAGTGKRTKRRAVVAMARKLAVLLHRLWVTAEVYDPHYNRKAREHKLAKAARRVA